MKRVMTAPVAGYGVEDPKSSSAKNLCLLGLGLLQMLISFFLVGDSACVCACVCVCVCACIWLLLPVSRIDHTLIISLSPHVCV